MIAIFFHLFPPLPLSNFSLYAQFRKPKVLPLTLVRQKPHNLPQQPLSKRRINRNILQELNRIFQPSLTHPPSDNLLAERLPENLD